MEVKISLVLTVLLILGQANFGTALRCYVCTTSPDDRRTCASPFSRPSSLLKDCSTFKSDPTVVTNRTMLPASDITPVATYYYSCCRINVILPSGENYWERTCIVKTDPSYNQCNHLDLAPGTSLKSCRQCDTDGCNSSSSIAVSLPIILLGLFFVCRN